jgi:hypothetical protein
VTENLTVSSAVVADPEHQYKIPFQKLRGWTKQVNVTVGTSPNKALLSVNGTMTDQAGPTVLAAVQAVVAIGAAAAIPGASLVTMPTSELASRATQLKLSSNQRAIANAFKMNNKNFSAPEYRSMLALDDRQFSILNGLIPEKAAPLPTPAAATLCNADVHTALSAIKAENDIIQKYKPAPGAAGVAAPLPAAGATAPVSGQAGSSSPTDPHVVQAQARLTEITSSYKLVRRINFTWTPARTEISGYKKGDNLILLSKSIDLYGDIAAPAWLTDNGSKLLKQSADKDTLAGKQAKILTTPVNLQLAVNAWTVGRDWNDPGLDGSAASANAPTNGLIVRDPALGLVRTCLGPCTGLLVANAAGQGVKSNVVTASDNPNNTITEVTADLAPALPLPLPQLGRFEIEPVEDGLFESSTASATLNADSTVSSVGNQSSNVVAGTTGLGAVTASANAEASGIAARNTAVGAVNTAASSAATNVDNLNKALADCLTQQAAILHAGGKPIGSCQ